jgi:hypothetical protein
MTLSARIVELGVGRFVSWKVLYLTLIKSMEGNWVSGSTIIKCPNDKYVWLKGSSDKVNKGLEFRQASISASNVDSSS